VPPLRSRRSPTPPEEPCVGGAAPLESKAVPCVPPAGPSSPAGSASLPPTAPVAGLLAPHAGPPSALKGGLQKPPEASLACGPAAAAVPPARGRRLRDATAGVGGAPNARKPAGPGSDAAVIGRPPLNDEL
jgi:hypothetical protein